MNDEIKKEIPVIKENTAITVLRAESATVDKNAEEAILKKLNENNKLLTDYDGNVKKAYDEMLGRLKSSETSAAEEFAKIKAQSEARYKEIEAKITQNAASIYVELEKRGLAADRGSFMKNFEAGFIRIGKHQIALSAIIISLTFQKQTNYFWREDSEDKGQTWTELLYGAGDQSISVPGKPLKLISGNTKDIFFEKLRKIYQLDSSGQLVPNSTVIFYDNVKPSTVDITSVLGSVLKVTTPTPSSADKMRFTPAVLEVLPAIAGGAIVVEYDRTYALHASINIKSVLIQIAALALSQASGTLGMFTSLMGENLWDKVMSDVKADPFLAKLAQ